MIIRITEEMFDDAVVNAMHKFSEISRKADKLNGEKVGANVEVEVMMGLQNAVFASMVRAELFDNIKEEK